MYFPVSFSQLNTLQNGFIEESLENNGVNYSDVNDKQKVSSESNLSIFASIAIAQANKESSENSSHTYSLNPAQISQRLKRTRNHRSRLTKYTLPFTQAEDNTHLQNDKSSKPYKKKCAVIRRKSIKEQKESQTQIVQECDSFLDLVRQNLVPKATPLSANHSILDGLSQLVERTHLDLAKSALQQIDHDKVLNDEYAPQLSKVSDPAERHKLNSAKFRKKENFRMELRQQTIKIFFIFHSKLSEFFSQFDHLLNLATNPNQELDLHLTALINLYLEHTKLFEKLKNTVNIDTHSSKLTADLAIDRFSNLNSEKVDIEALRKNSRTSFSEEDSENTVTDDETYKRKRDSQNRTKSKDKIGKKQARQFRQMGLHETLNLQNTINEREQKKLNAGISRRYRDQKNLRREIYNHNIPCYDKLISSIQNSLKNTQDVLQTIESNSEEIGHYLSIFENISEICMLALLNISAIEETSLKDQSQKQLPSENTDNLSLKEKNKLAAAAYRKRLKNEDQLDSRQIEIYWDFHKKINSILLSEDVKKLMNSSTEQGSAEESFKLVLKEILEKNEKYSKKLK